MDNALEQLQALLGDGKVSTSPSVLEQHGRDENEALQRPMHALDVAVAGAQMEPIGAAARCGRRFSARSGHGGIVIGPARLVNGLHQFRTGSVR